MNNGNTNEIMLANHDDGNNGNTDILDDAELVECANCGNIWDGYAQCNCWQINNGQEDAYANDADSGYAGSQNN